MPSVAEFLRPHHPFKIVSGDFGVQDHYVHCRRQGTSHRLSEMFAFESGPALDTATRWLGGHDDFTINENTLFGQTLLANAADAGVSTRGKVYKSGLARFPGDPRALVESKDDCIRIAREDNLTLEGGINYKPPETIEPSDWNKPYRVADSIVEEHYADAVAADPSVATKKDAKEAIAAKLSGQD